MIKKINNIVLVGSSHVSNSSVKEIEETIQKEDPSIIAVELDRRRYMKLKNDNTGGVPSIRDPLLLFLFVIQQLTGLVKRVTPGSDMKKAMEMAEKRGTPLHLIDRSSIKTFQRFSSNLTIFEKIKLFVILSFSPVIILIRMMLSRITKKEKYDLSEVSEDTKEIDRIVGVLKGFPKIYNPLLYERDIIMSMRLAKYLGTEEKVVAVVGAGHVPGMTEKLEELDNIKKVSKSKRFRKEN